KARGYVVVGAFVIAAVVTPPDVVSQFMLAVPLGLLYEVGLICARMVTPGRKDEDAENAAGCPTEHRCTRPSTRAPPWTAAARPMSLPHIKRTLLLLSARARQP